MVADTKKQKARPLTKSDFSNVAVLVPCLDEAVSIARVIGDFRGALPGAKIYVFDNGSADDTVRIARENGAIVRVEPRRGKGNVIARMFRDVEADYFLLVDGDATYDAAAAPQMIEKVRTEFLDVLIGVRKGSYAGQYRPGHQLGNSLFTMIIRLLFNAQVSDVLSGYRLMSRRFVKSFPVSARGFEIETELTVHMLEVGVPFGEFPAEYFNRPETSESKLNTWKDGFRILRTIATLVAAERPIAVFCGLGMASIIVGVLAFLPILAEYNATGVVPRFPTLIASTTLGIIGLIACFGGLVLDGVTRTRRDMKKLAFLAQVQPSGAVRR